MRDVFAPPRLRCRAWLAPACAAPSEQFVKLPRLQSRFRRHCPIANSTRDGAVVLVDH